MHLHVCMYAVTWRMTHLQMIICTILQRYDMIFSDLSITASREKVVDFTTSYWEVAKVIMLKRPGQAGKSFRFLFPFHMHVWISIPIVLIFTGCITCLFSKLSPLSSWNLEDPESVMDEISISENIWSMLGSFLQQGNTYINKRQKYNFNIK